MEEQKSNGTPPAGKPRTLNEIFAEIGAAVINLEYKVTGMLELHLEILKRLSIHGIETRDLEALVREARRRDAQSTKLGQPDPEEKSDIIVL